MIDGVWCVCVCAACVRTRTVQVLLPNSLKLVALVGHNEFVSFSADGQPVVEGGAGAEAGAAAADKAAGDGGKVGGMPEGARVHMVSAQGAGAGAGAAVPDHTVLLSRRAGAGSSGEGAPVGGGALLASGELMLPSVGEPGGGDGGSSMAAWAAAFTRRVASAPV